MLFPKPHTYRSKKYLAFIRTKNCLVCGNPETVAHHEGLGGNMMSGKPPDSHTVPLCWDCHGKLGWQGTDTFWKRFDIKFEIIKLLTEYLDGHC